MTDVDTLFREYREAHRSGGEADPSEFLSKVEGTDRSELAALIDAYLARSTGRTWDSEGFLGSTAERVTNQLASSWDEWELAPEPTGWQELLPALRNRASLKRRELVKRLAEALGVGGQAERVAAYYHEMETGTLPPDGVSNRVLDALGDLLGETRERLRAAGAATAEASEMDLSVSFARTAIQNAAYDTAPAAASPGRESSDEEGSAGRVDELFTGGADAGT